MLIFWKRNEREEREARKRAEKEALDKLKKEEELREAKRQQRKLNFLITQTELYSHFVGSKIEPEEKQSKDTSKGFETFPSKGLDVNHPEVEAVEFGQVDFDEEDEGTLHDKARQSAQYALQKQMNKTKAFDQEAAALRTASNLEAAAHAAFLGNDSVPPGSLEDGNGNPVAMEEAIDHMDFLNPSSLKADSEIEQPKMLNCSLKDYQLKGLNWLANLYEQGINGILADEMGLGKTVQSISLMAYLAETHNIWGPFLIISPVSTLHNWQQEIAKFAPDLKVLPYWGNQEDRKILRKFWTRKKLYRKDAPFHILITSYQMVVTDEKYFQKLKWQYMVLDEAQAIKSSTSMRWNVLLKFHCRNRLLLTGTPIQNTMQELWALLHFIMPTLFDSHEEFSDWFSKDIESHAQDKGSLNEHQLKRLHMILKPFMLRRIKKDVENELSPKVELEIKCHMTARQRRMYQGLKSKISVSELLQRASSLSHSNEGVDSLMNIVMQFRKVCNHPELFERAEVMSPVQLMGSHFLSEMYDTKHDLDFPLITYYGGPGGSGLNGSSSGGRPCLKMNLPALLYQNRLLNPNLNFPSIWNSDWIHNSIQTNNLGKVICGLTFNVIYFLDSGGLSPNPQNFLLWFGVTINWEFYPHIVLIISDSIESHRHLFSLNHLTCGWTPTPPT